MPRKFMQKPRNNSVRWRRWRSTYSNVRTYRVTGKPSHSACAVSTRMHFPFTIYMFYRSESELEDFRRRCIWSLQGTLMCLLKNLSAHRLYIQTSTELLDATATRKLGSAYPWDGAQKICRALSPRSFHPQCMQWKVDQIRKEKKKAKRSSGGRGTVGATKQITSLMSFTEELKMPRYE